jgi:hypothetical protein
MSFRPFYTLFSSVLVFCLVGLISCDNTVETEQEPSITLMEKEPFRQVHLNGKFRVIIKPSSAYEVRFVGEHEIAKSIHIRTKNNVLEIRGNEMSTAIQRPLLLVYAPHVDLLSLNGQCTVKANHIKQKSMTIFNQGVSKISLKGELNALNLQTSGSLKLLGDELSAKQVNLITQGINQLVFNSSEKISMESEGFNKVYYLGSPEIEKKFSGYCKIQPFDAKKGRQLKKTFYNHDFWS